MLPFIYKKKKTKYGVLNLFDRCILKILIIMPSSLSNRPFPSSPRPLFQNAGRCSAFDMEITFHFHANKTHFHKKGCARSLIVKVRPITGK